MSQQIRLGRYRAAALAGQFTADNQPPRPVICQP
jgi:hypothetical protein